MSVAIYTFSKWSTFFLLTIICCLSISVLSPYLFVIRLFPPFFLYFSTCRSPFYFPNSPFLPCISCCANAFHPSSFYRIYPSVNRKTPINSFELCIYFRDHRDIINKFTRQLNIHIQNTRRVHNNIAYPACIHTSIALCISKIVSIWLCLYCNLMQFKLMLIP